MAAVLLPADTADDEVARHKQREHQAEIAQASASSKQTSEMDVQVLDAPEPLRDEDAVVAIRMSGLTPEGLSGSAVGLRTGYAGEKLRRDDPLVKRKPDAFVDVCNGIPRDRAVVALQQVGSVDENGHERVERVIYQGTWAELDDPLVQANRHVFKRAGFE